MMDRASFALGFDGMNRSAEGEGVLCREHASALLFVFMFSQCTNFSTLDMIY